MHWTEIIVIAFSALVLYGGRGISAFAERLGDAWRAFDEAGGGFDAGHGLRNSFGRRVFEALTPDNKTIELHDPHQDKIPLGKFLLFLSLFVLGALTIFLALYKFI